MSLLDSSTLPHKCRTQRRSQTPGVLADGDVARDTLALNIPCWEQPVGTSEANRYDKLGISVETKVYFLTDPGLTERDEIVITERTGRDGRPVPVPVANQREIQVVRPSMPDSSVGLGILFKVMGSYSPGRNS